MFYLDLLTLSEDYKVKDFLSLQLYMGCSICGAEGVTKVTCPFNDQAKNPKPTKHNKAPKGQASRPAAASGAMTAPLKLKSKLKKPSASASSSSSSSASSKPSSKPSASASSNAFDMRQMQQEAERLFPNDPDTQADYVGKYMYLAAPQVPKGDAIHKEYEAKKRARQQKRDAMAKQCAQCIKGVKLHKMIKDPNQWLNLSRICDSCQRSIGELYHDKDFKEDFKSYHKGNLPMDQLIARGPTSGYYNATMHTGAKYWSGVAARRAGDAMPKPPTGPPGRF